MRLGVLCAARAGTGSWWSDINPLAQRLAAERVLLSDDGLDAWEALGQAKAAGEGTECTLHVWYADAPGSVVSLDGPGGIEEMRQRVPRAEYRFFAGSGHSIHNDRGAAADYNQALREVVDAAARRGARAPSGGVGPRGG